MHPAGTSCRPKTRARCSGNWCRTTWSSRRPPREDSSRRQPRKQPAGQRPNPRRCRHRQPPSKRPRTARRPKQRLPCPHSQSCAAPNAPGPPGNSCPAHHRESPAPARADCPAGSSCPAPGHRTKNRPPAPDPARPAPASNGRAVPCPWPAAPRGCSGPSSTTPGRTSVHVWRQCAENRDCGW